MKKSLLLLLSFCFLLAVQAARPPKNQVSKKKKSSIVGGSETQNSSQFPYHVLLVSPNGGGSIISKRWVLTAAHLGITTGTNVYTGSINRNSLNLPKQVLQFNKHTSYGGGSHPNFDVALVQVNSDFALGSGNVEMIKLTGPIDGLSVGQPVTVSGFGYTQSGGSLSNILKFITVPISSFTISSKIIAGGLINGTINDSCQGDSGEL